ncbi:MAG: response regulator [Novosphingobium sp.]|nr:response regulator [Novosphingobium sp.]
MKQISALPLTAPPASTESWYLSAMERLVAFVQDLSHARDLDAVTAVVRDAARNLTGADGATFVLRDGDNCYYAEENAIAPLWKGLRFPMSQCVSGWVMVNAQSVVIEDIYDDPRVPVEAYRPTFVKSMAMVPIRRTSPIGAIGNYWSTHRLPSAEELAVLQALADTTSVALENAELYTRLQGMIRRLQDQQVRIGEQHASLGIFTRALAHDLREPVRTLVSFSEMLQEEPQDQETQATYLRFITDSAARMGTLIDSVAHYTRLDSPEISACSLCLLSDVVAEIRQNLARIIAERGTTIVHGPLPSLVADPVHLRQLLQNLVSNAILHNDGPVTISIASKRTAEGLLLSVSDDGIGIPASQSEQVFEPFRRLVHRNDASGLGLAICRRIVSLYGGTIRCENGEGGGGGGGATFSFSLPGAEPPETPAAEAENDSLAMANVLIVDDREADLEMTEIALFRRPKLRCNLQSARDGREAHRLLTTPGALVDLVLLDINMPDVDGFRLLEEIRNDDALRDILVVMCSGSDYEPDRKRSAALGAAGYLLKPPRFSNFRDIVAEQPCLRLLDESNGMCLMRRSL